MLVPYKVQFSKCLMVRKITHALLSRAEIKWPDEARDKAHSSTSTRQCGCTSARPVSSGMIEVARVSNTWRCGRESVSNDPKIIQILSKESEVLRINKTDNQSLLRSRPSVQMRKLHSTGRHACCSFRRLQQAKKSEIKIEIKAW